MACGLFFAPAVTVLAEDVEPEYQRQFDALEPNDITGHYKLALWCKEKKAYRLLRKQATYILRKNKDHEPAKLLLEVAKRELEAAGEGDEAGPGAGTSAEGAPGRIITDAEVQFLRRAELILDPPEQIRVKFYNDVLRRFFTEVEGTAGFDYSRKQFFTLPPHEKARLILQHAPEAFAEDLEIVTDPQRFSTFRRQVLPIVLDTCATAACHGAKGGGHWRIYSDKVLSTNQVYTNYLIMHEYTLDTDRLINRDAPAKSLLLTCALPQGSQDHSVPIDPAFRSERDRKYLTILDWVKSLAVQTPDYGISLSARPQRAP